MSLRNLPYEQTDWNTETRESDQTLDATEFNANDTLVSTGSAWVGKSVSEMKTLLGLPLVYEAFVDCSAGDPDITTIKNEIGGSFVFTRGNTGYISLIISNVTLPLDKTIVLAQPFSSSILSPKVSLFARGTGNFSFYCSGHDDAGSDGVDFYLTIKKYS